MGSRDAGGGLGGRVHPGVWRSRRGSPWGVCSRLPEAVRAFLFPLRPALRPVPSGTGLPGGRRRGRELRAGPFLVRCPAKRFGAPAEAPGPVGARGEDTTQVRASGTCRQHSLEPSVPGCHQLCAEELARLS